MRPQAAQQLRLHLEQEVGDGEEHVEQKRVLLRLHGEVYLLVRIGVEGSGGVSKRAFHAEPIVRNS